MAQQKTFGTFTRTNGRGLRTTVEAHTPAEAVKYRFDGWTEVQEKPEAAADSDKAGADASADDSAGTDAGADAGGKPHAGRNRSSK